MSRLARALFVWALLAMTWLAMPARADDIPRGLTARDVLDAPPGAPPLRAPPVPTSYIHAQRGSIEIAYAPNLASQVEATLAHVEQDARVLARQLGFAEVPPLQVRIVPDAEAMRRLAPADAPPPVYAVGVAYPRIGLTLVASSAPGSHELADIRRVLRHELSHLLLETATDHAPIPRWFSEGVAVHQANEYSFDRFKALAVASFTRGILPLRQLDSGFEGNGEHVEVAYAEAADFVAWLLRAGGDARFALLLSHLRESMTLDAAVRQTYGRSFAQIEYEWRSDLDTRFLTAPLWAGTGFLWLVGLLLLVLAFAKRRRQSRKTLARWAREEANVDRLIAEGPLPGLTIVTPGLHSLGTRDDSTPSVLDDGKRHTLN